jgi:hypothetical protein
MSFDVSLADALGIVASAAKWSNENQGLIAIGIFLVTIVLGWLSGIFSALRRKPKFKLTIIPGPTFCCTFRTGRKYQGYDVHRTGFALYLNISNIGSASSSIENIALGYHRHGERLAGLLYMLRWYWLHEQATALADFQGNIGDQVKIYPFLIQQSYLAKSTVDTFLDVGRSRNGIVYFEQENSYGTLFPAVKSGSVRLKVGVQDVFGRWHYAKFTIPSFSLEEAQKFNPAFGKSFELTGERAGDLPPHSG